MWLTSYSNESVYRVRFLHATNLYWFVDLGGMDKPDPLRLPRK